MNQETEQKSSAFNLLLACYRSEQISEEQFEKHLEDPLFAAWYQKQLKNGVKDSNQGG